MVGDQPVPVGDDAPQNDFTALDAEVPGPARPPIYARPAVRAVLIVGALITTLALLALFPSTYWRF
jgi:hypothetical protein